MKKYFTYNSQYLTGGKYWIRVVLQTFLIYFLIGLYLLGVTTYARAKSLKHSDNTSLLFAIINPLFLIISTSLSLISKYEVNNYGVYQIIVLLLLSLHFYLWFANGEGVSNIDSNASESKKESITTNNMKDFSSHENSVKKVTSNNSYNNSNEQIFTNDSDEFLHAINKIRNEKDLVMQEYLCKKFIDEISPNSEIYNLLAKNLYKQKKYPQGIEYISIAIEKSPNNSDYYNTLSNGYYYGHKLKRALIEIDTCISIGERTNGLKAKYLFNRAAIHFDLGDIDYAVLDLKKSIDIDANFQPSLSLLENIQTGALNINYDTELPMGWKDNSDISDAAQFTDALEKTSNISSDENHLDKKLNIILAQFKEDLNSESFQEYPIQYWYDIVKVRAAAMKTNSKDLSKLEIQKKWTWMHADEYKTKYMNTSKTESIEEISLRVSRFSNIYELLCDLEVKLSDLAKEYKLILPSFLEDFYWEKVSAAASFYGCVNFALHIGMSNEEITKLYSNYKYDKELVDGLDPFEKYGFTKEKAHDLIRENTSIDINEVKSEQIEIHKFEISHLTQLDTEMKHAVFAVLCYIANSDGITKDEDVILQDVLRELEINIEAYNNSNIDGGIACDLLQNIDEFQKNELSRLIVLIVGADRDFSSEEMLWVNDIISELDLDENILMELIEKYWKK